MAELVKRLRVIADNDAAHEYTNRADILRSAASRIEALESREGALREALEPFAKVASRENAHGSTIGHKDMPDTQPVMLTMLMGRQEYTDMSLTLGNFRSVLKAAEEK